ncbi:hypothetical protein KBH77_01600 [Patescibacteria group bacterium]|nr:hypothetical protein [Patescibacteria group bacterium]
MKKQKEDIKTKEELLKILDKIPIKNKQQRNELVCSLIGHSRICDTFWGYRYCGRCGAQLGDSLGSIDFGAKESVIIGHNCPTCRENYKKCDWRDKLYVKNPFTKTKK